MKRYFYGRVSSMDQSLDRQIAAAHSYAEDIDRIFTDKKSGKNFDRAGYMEMKECVEPGDEVIVKELDRLGRNSELMKKELQWFKDNGVTVRVLDIPTTLVDFGGQDWVREMVTNILVEVMSAIAEQERVKIQRRREEGIAEMPVVDGRKVSKKTGRGFGRPTGVSEDEFARYADMVGRGETSVSAACKKLGIGRSSWYRMANRASDARA